MANQSGPFEDRAEAGQSTTDVPPLLLPPSPVRFTYALDPHEVSNGADVAAQPVVPYQAIRRWQDPTVPDPAQPADVVLDAYPKQQRVRVRRHGESKRSHSSRPPAGPRRTGWLLLLAVVIGGALSGGAFYYRALQERNTAARTAALSGAPAPLAAPFADSLAVPLAAPLADNAPANVTASTTDLLTSPDAVIARAVIKPSRAAALGMTVGGRVKELLVAEGDTVTAGQALIRLDDNRQMVAIAQARAGLQQVEAQLLELQAGARTEEIAAAQAVVDGAQARLDTLLHDTVQAADEAAAVAAVTAAEAKLQELANGPAEETLIAARAEMQKAQAALTTAQAAYDAVAWRSDVGMLPESTQLQQATIAYEAAQAQYNELSVGPDNAELSAARAEIETARANLARTQTPVQVSEIDAARAELRQAQAQLDLLLAGTRTEAVSAAEAAVSAAQATLMEAEVALDETVLTAPFTGTIAALEVEVGEQLAPRAPVIQLGDLAAWQLETDDLIELDMVRVQPGARVAVTVDALPGVELSGKVVRVKPIGEDKIGDMTYTAYIALGEQAAGLAWNMTATVYIGGLE